MLDDIAVIQSCINDEVQFDVRHLRLTAASCGESLWSGGLARNNIHMQRYRNKFRTTGQYDGLHRYVTDLQCPRWISVTLRCIFSHKMNTCRQRGTEMWSVQGLWSLIPTFLSILLVAESGWLLLPLGNTVAENSTQIRPECENKITYRYLFRGSILEDTMTCCCKKTNMYQVNLNHKVLKCLKTLAMVH